MACKRRAAGNLSHSEGGSQQPGPKSAGHERNLVIPAKAGISCRRFMRLWSEMPAFAGMTYIALFHEFVERDSGSRQNEV